MMIEEKSLRSSEIIIVWKESQLFPAVPRTVESLPSAVYHKQENAFSFREQFSFSLSIELVCGYKTRAHTYLHIYKIVQANCCFKCPKIQN